MYIKKLNQIFYIRTKKCVGTIFPLLEIKSIVYRNIEN